MDFVDFAIAVLYGIVQGITEWLPISSTAHLMLLERCLPGVLSGPFFNLFLVAIQLGSVFAVITHYLRVLVPIGAPRNVRKESRALWIRMLLGSVPAGVVGFFVDDALEQFFSRGDRGTIAVAVALAFYGAVFLVADRIFQGKSRGNFHSDKLSIGDAIRVGCFQILALVPGTSRSGATVLGGMALGYERSRAAEFSFFLSVPIMAGATILRAIKLMLDDVCITTGEALFLLVGMITAFLVSLLTMRFLVGFVRRYGFSVFGWYRLALSVTMLLFFVF